jgi:nitroreductase
LAVDVGPWTDKARETRSCWAAGQAALRRYAAAVDAFLAIASKREVRRYPDRPLPDQSVRRILDAGRVSGSSANRQRSRFVAITDRERLERLAETVYTPDNVRGAQLAVAIAVHGKGPTSFDAGRAAQNMMLAAWNEGVGSCPNGMLDRGAAARVLGLREGEEPANRPASELVGILYASTGRSR